MIIISFKNCLTLRPGKLSNFDDEQKKKIRNSFLVIKNESNHPQSLAEFKEKKNVCKLMKY